MVTGPTPAALGVSTEFKVPVISHGTALWICFWLRRMHQSAFIGSFASLSQRSNKERTRQCQGHDRIPSLTQPPKPPKPRGTLTAEKMVSATVTAWCRTGWPIVWSVWIAWSNTLRDPTPSQKKSNASPASRRDFPMRDRGPLRRSQAVSLPSSCRAHPGPNLRPCWIHRLKER